MNRETIHCPICQALFSLPEPTPRQKKLDKLMRSARAKKLRRDGFTIRQIMKILKYKSPRSVQDLLDND
jgi:hypothetical protein